MSQEPTPYGVRAIRHGNIDAVHLCIYDADNKLYFHHLIWHHGENINFGGVWCCNRYLDDIEPEGLEYITEFIDFPEKEGRMMNAVVKPCAHTPIELSTHVNIYLDGTNSFRSLSLVDGVDLITDVVGLLRRGKKSVFSEFLED